MFTNPDQRDSLITALAHKLIGCSPAELLPQKDTEFLEGVRRYFSQEYPNEINVLDLFMKHDHIDEKAREAQDFLLSAKEAQEPKSTELLAYQKQIDAKKKPFSSTKEANAKEAKKKPSAPTKLPQLDKKLDLFLSLLRPLYSAKDIFIDHYLFIKQFFSEKIALSDQQLLMLTKLLSNLKLDDKKYFEHALSSMLECPARQQKLSMLLSLPFQNILNKLSPEDLMILKKITADRIEQGVSTDAQGNKTDKLIDDLKLIFQQIEKNSGLLRKIGPQATYKDFSKIVLLESYGSEALGEDNKPTARAKAFLNDGIDAEIFKRSLILPDSAIKTRDDLPDIKITNPEYKGYSLTKLNPQNYQGFFLGEFTDCCQSMNNHAEECIIDGMQKSTSSFYVLKKEDTIVGQCYAWISEKENIVFDSIEVRKKGAQGQSIYAPIAKSMFTQAAQEIVKDDRFKRVFVGLGGATKTVLGNRLISTALADRPLLGTAQYKDSQDQAPLAISSVLHDSLFLEESIEYKDEYELSALDYFLSQPRDRKLMTEETAAKIKFFIDKGGDPYEFLKNAVEHGCFGEVSFVIDYKNLSLNNPKAVDALYCACENGNLEIVDLFLGLRMNLNTKQKGDVLALACMNVHVDILLSLKKSDIVLNKKAAIEALQKACRDGHLELVKFLAAQGAVIHAQNDKTGLYESCCNGHFEIAKLLIAKRAQFKSEETRATLEYVCINGHFEIAKLLIEPGVLLDDKKAADILHQVCINGHFQIAKLLIAKQAQFKSEETRATLEYVCINGHFEIAKLLIERGVILDDKKETGILHQVCINGHFEIAELLIEARLPFDTKIDGKTLLELVQEKDCHDMVALIHQKESEKLLRPRALLFSEAQDLAASNSELAAFLRSSESKNP